MPVNDVQELIIEMMTKMKGFIEEGREAMPIVFVITKTDKIEIYGIANMNNSEAKDEVSELIHNLTDNDDNLVVCFMADSFCRTTSTEEEYRALRQTYNEVRLMPGRREGIAVTINAKGMASQFAYWKYDRGEMNKPVFEEKPEFPNFSAVSGRFAVMQENAKVN